MKNTSFLTTFILLMIFSISCGDDDTLDSGIVGTWEFTEQLSDPGDGSGVFMEVDSDKTITFNADGTLESNGPLSTHVGTLDGGPSTGTYNLSDSSITLDSLDFQRIFNFIVDGNELVINYLCIEPCASKYKRQ